MIVVLGLYYRDWDIGFDVEDVVGSFRLAPSDHLSPDDDAPFCKRDLLTDLDGDVPARFFQSRSDELGADVPFAEAFLVH